MAVSPSDTAPALIALDAQMVIRRAGGGERVVPAEEYFVGPGMDIMRMTVLRPGELLTAIRIPGTWAGAQFYFEKVRDRQVWDFPLVNVASAMKVSGGTIEALRLAVGAVAARPLRLTAVEAAVAGQAAQRRDGDAGRRAGDRRGAGAALQRLQDSADAQPGQARHPRRPGSDDLEAGSSTNFEVGTEKYEGHCVGHGPS